MMAKRKRWFMVVAAIAPTVLYFLIILHQIPYRFDLQLSSDAFAMTASPPTTFKIIVLTMNRFASLNRLLESLQAADYGSDTVDLEVRFDRPPKEDDKYFLTQVQAFENDLTWTAGNATVSVASTNLGLRQAWLSAWRPANTTTERAIIFEDDITVSPLWYRWLAGASEAYRDRSDIVGFSLQRQQLIPLKKQQQGRIPDNGGLPFLYKLVGSIGYAPTAAHWLDFLDFAECALATNLSVRTPELITSDWYDVLDQRGMWTQLFIYFCKQKDLYTLYTFPTDPKQALAAHWREKGEHFDKTGGRDFQLATAEDLRLEYPSELPKLGWGAEPVTEESNQSARHARTLVMSAAVGYGHSEYERFVSNLREHYDGDVVLLVWQDAPPETFEFLKAHNIRVVTTPETGGARMTQEWDRVNRVRWQFYSDACRYGRYDWCMALDFRDALFQDNPFRGMIKSKEQAGAVLHVYEHNLVMNEWHLDQALRCNKTNDALKGKKIINAGGFVGSPEVFPQLTWLNLERGKGCDDQVALNLGVWGGLLNATTTIHSHPQGEGIINNVAHEGKFHRDKRGHFLNRNCFPAPVVHQFDLIPR